MKKIILLNKKEGETPLEALGRFRNKNRKHKDLKMTYAGRLDPMAEGLLLVLAGDEVHKKEKYLKLSKVYEFSILFGFATDTYDILGKVVDTRNIHANAEYLKKIIIQNLKYFRGKFNQEYPPFSSKTWVQARMGSLGDKESKKVNVYSLKFIKIKSINSKKLLKKISSRIGKVKGDFRQKEIIEIWRGKLVHNSNNFFIADFKIKCSGGTYVRGIAESLGKKIGIPALAFSIKRTKVGKWGRI